MRFKPGTLAARWRANFEGCGPDIVFSYPESCDGSLLNSFFCHEMVGDKTLIQELEDRGYDLATLQFTIRRKV